MSSCVILSRLGVLSGGSDFIAAFSSARETIPVSIDGIWESSVSSLAIILLMFSSTNSLNGSSKLKSLINLCKFVKQPQQPSTISSGSLPRLSSNLISEPLVQR